VSKKNVYIETPDAKLNKKCVDYIKIKKKLLLTHFYKRLCETLQPKSSPLMRDDAKSVA
jgi:hypothetical protein